jgi:glutathione reductase (NADPH)
MNNQGEKGDTFDLVVIGTGTAASTTAYECSSAGWNVAIIDSLPFGGTCALRGCDPKKVLVEAAKIIDSNQRHENKGITGSEAVHVKWADLLRFKRTFTEPFPMNREDGYIKAGIVPFHGHATFIGPTTIKVKKVHDGSNNDNDDSTILSGRHILVATGSKPMNLNVPGSEHIITSDRFMELDGNNLPDRILFVGGGYISFEFAHIAARAGAKVTVLHRGKQPLEHFDPDLVNKLVQWSRDIGIDVRLQAAVKRIDRSSMTSKFSNNESDKLVVYYSSSDLSKSSSKSEYEGDTKTSLSTGVAEADLVVHGAGREPNIDGLDLGDAAGVQYTHRGITVNEYLQSVSNPAVYAAGDVAANMGLPLTPVASYDGAVVANNLLKGNSWKSNYTGLPSVVFTIPPLVSVGMQEKEAKEKGLRVRINYQDTSGWASSRRIGETCAAFKVLIEEDSNRILGAHILGSHAEEVINIFSMAIRLGLTAKDLNDPLLYTYPTNSSDILYML